MRIPPRPSVAENLDFEMADSVDRSHGLSATRGVKDKVKSFSFCKNQLVGRNLRIVAH